MWRQKLLALNWYLAAGGFGRHLSSSTTIGVSVSRSFSFAASASSFPHHKASFTTRTTLSSNNNGGIIPDYDELPMDNDTFPRRDDVLVGLEAVRRAAKVTCALQPNENGAEISTLSKLDCSPVTVGDFAAQAIVLQLLSEKFPDDGYIAEESSEALQQESASSSLTQSILNATSKYISDPEALYQCLDIGKSYEQWEHSNDKSPPHRVWCLDPIDGTKGFLRGRTAGGQYAICLGLIEDGIPTIGILACPNLPLSSSSSNNDYEWKEGETLENNADTRGCIFVASRGGGCYQLPLVPGDGGPSIVRKLDTTRQDTRKDLSKARFCVGVEQGFADPEGKCKAMASHIHGGLDDATNEIQHVTRIDSQAKYGLLARGDGEFYVRLPKPGYQEYIWDVAPGVVVLQEAGGIVTDVEGNAIFSSSSCTNSRLPPSVTGIIGASDPELHNELIALYQEMFGE